jgi:hypothetical protein
MDFRGIVLDHISTLRDFGKQRGNPREIAFFFLIPIIWAGIQISLNYRTTDSLVNLLVTAASIFAGLLLNLLVLIYTVASRPERPEVSEIKRVLARDLLRETFFNISYGILVSVLLVISCLLLPQDGTTGSVQKSIVDAFVYYFSAQLVLSLLLILKRVHALLRHELQPET